MAYWLRDATNVIVADPAHHMPRSRSSRIARRTVWQAIPDSSARSRSAGSFWSGSNPASPAPRRR
jgi:hypothetical protein